jgi:GNAT superfamily N-acetyltransferase
MVRARSVRGRARARPVRAKGGSVRLRWAGPSDLATLVRHRRLMWRELRDYTPAELDRHDVVYRRWVRLLMARGKFLAVLAETRDGRVVGSGALWLMPSQPRPGPLGRGEMPYVLSMYTDPERRGEGVATRIVRELVRWSRARRYGRVVLHASRFGRPVYARLGFEDGSEMRLELGPPARPRRAVPRRSGPKA